MNETRMCYNRSIPLIFFVVTRTLSLLILLVQFFHRQVHHVSPCLNVKYIRSLPAAHFFLFNLLLDSL